MRLRRVVTGHDAAGRAVVWKDGPPPTVFGAVEGITSALLWSTDSTPADYTGENDMGARKLGIAPPPGGTRFSFLEIQPGNQAYMHRTDTVDFIVCVAGEIEMDLDQSTVKLAAGDVMIQRGTSHAWVNRGSVTARIAVVLIDGKPKRGGSHETS